MSQLKKILLVDDDNVNLKSTSLRLIKRNFEVTTLNSSAAVLASVVAHRPDVVLLDIMMPIISGLEVLKELRDTYSQVELPVIMVTSKESVADVTGALRLGANDYLRKPINMEIAVARIEAQATIVRLHRELLAKNELEAVHALIVTYNHEINNPLAIALGNLEIATRNGSTLELERASRAMLRISEIVKSIAAIQKHGVTFDRYHNDTKMIHIRKAL